MIETGFALDLKIESSQAKLSASEVEPRVDAILERLAEHRAAADEHFGKQIEASKKRGDDGRYSDVIWARYPFGFCRHIRDAVFDRLLNDRYFQELKEKGILLKPIFIFLRGSYFQNAIQIGNYYFDVANDTVVTTKPKLDWAPVSELDYENVDSWQRFAHVARKYLTVELYPNLCFPLIFPAAPFFAIHEDGTIQILLVQWQVLLKDLGDDMRRTLNLLNDNEHLERALPPAYQSLLENKFGGNLYNTFPVEFSLTTPSELKETILPEFIEISKQPGSQAYTTIRNYGLLVEESARKLRLLNLRPDDDELQRLRAEGVVPNATR